ncbi:hypothetical protein BDK51DRAFT_34894, partial [Blyttiomyces helicus]
IFFFIEPTKANLKKYELWAKSPNQGQTFLADSIKGGCIRVRLVAGNTMLIPTGWIHAVYTPQDSVVIGGNFLQGMNIAGQLEIYDIEDKTSVPQKFRFPHFEKMQWYAAKKYLSILKETPRELCKWELDGLQSLITFLSVRAEQLTDISNTTKEERKAVKRNVPVGIKNVQKLLRKLQTEVDAARRSIAPVIRFLVPAGGLPGLRGEAGAEAEVAASAPQPAIKKIKLRLGVAGRFSGEIPSAETPEDTLAVKTEDTPLVQSSAPVRSPALAPTPAPELVLAPPLATESARAPVSVPVHMPGPALRPTPAPIPAAAPATDFPPGSDPPISNPTSPALSSTSSGDWASDLTELEFLDSVSDLTEVEFLRSSDSEFEDYPVADSAADDIIPEEDDFETDDEFVATGGARKKTHKKRKGAATDAKGRAKKRKVSGGGGQRRKKGQESKGLMTAGADLPPAGVAAPGSTIGIGLSGPTVVGAAVPAAGPGLSAGHDPVAAPSPTPLPIPGHDPLTAPVVSSSTLPASTLPAMMVPPPHPLFAPPHPAHLGSNPGATHPSAHHISPLSVSSQPPPPQPPPILNQRPTQPKKKSVFERLNKKLGKKR